ncbi:hypothetical protein GCM10027047_25290 [Rhodococcus aerolatus]
MVGDEPGRRLPPPTASRYASVVDRAIREAQARGEFDDLPGAGRPIPPRVDHDTWVRGLVEREGLSADALLPESVRLRKELDRLPQTLAELRSEAEVRAEVAALNRRVVAWLRTPQGPPVRLAPVDADAAVARWRADRPTPAPRPAPPAPPPARTRRAWWRRRPRED